MSTWNNSNAETLGADLAAYGLARDIAHKEAGSSGGDPNFFGLRQNGREYSMQFGTPEALAGARGVNLAIVAPDTPAFDILVTKDLREAVRTADPRTLREFVSRILDEV